MQSSPILAGAALPFIAWASTPNGIVRRFEVFADCQASAIRRAFTVFPDATAISVRQVDAALLRDALLALEERRHA